MTETLEQIALRVAQETDNAVGGYPGTAWLYEYSRRLVTALGAQEPVSSHWTVEGAVGTKLYTAPQLPQREGWQWVPEKADVRMRIAGGTAGGKAFRERVSTEQLLNSMWAAMLAAAPKGPT